MKVGIMSMQRIVNYGSFLQAYGLKNAIESLGHDVVFVDYHTGAPLCGFEDDTPSVIQKSHDRYLNLLKPSYWRNRSAEQENNRIFGVFYEQFVNQYLPMLGIRKEKYQYQTPVDVLVIGSDEVFNCTQPVKEVGFSPELFGEKNQAEKVISYAASFGSATIGKLKFYGKDAEVGAYLKKNFSALSVRDENSEEIVTQLTGIKPYRHLDPVLISDFHRVPMKKFIESPYILVYAYCDRISPEEGAKIRAFAKRHRKKIVSVGAPQRFCDERIIADPFALLSYVKHADMVITDTFHGSVFSIKLNVPFVTLVRESNKQKLTSLLSAFHLEDRIIEKLDDLDMYVQKTVDFEPVNVILAEETARAMEYLNKNLILGGTQR